MALSKRMKEAIELLKIEEFYLCEFPTWSFWKTYNLPGKHIRTDTMKALEKRGVVKIEVNTGKESANKVAKLVIPDYEEITSSDYCIRCERSYLDSVGRYICRKTNKIVVSIDGRATINAIKCG